MDPIWPLQSKLTAPDWNSGAGNINYAEAVEVRQNIYHTIAQEIFDDAIGRSNLEVPVLDTIIKRSHLSVKGPSG